MKKILILSLIALSFSAQASIGWFIAGSVLGSSHTTENVLQSNKSNHGAFLEITQDSVCTNFNDGLEKNKKSTVLLRFDLIESVFEKRYTDRKTKETLTCVEIVFMNGQKSYSFLGKLEDFKAIFKKTKEETQQTKGK